MTQQGQLLQLLPCAIIVIGIVLPLLIYAVFGKQLRRRKRAQIRRLLDSED